MTKIGAVLTLCLALGSHVCAADTAEKLTGLPLHPGLSFQQDVGSRVCGKAVKISLYDPPSATATLAEFLGWYKAQLKGFHYVHKVWSKRAQETFYSPDGLTGVSVTGSVSGPGVFAVSYMKISAALTIQQMDAFDPANPTCK